MVDLSPLFTAARQAATLSREVQRQHIIKSEKQGHEPVTIADYGAQAILAHSLRQHFPDDGVISEESGTQFMELVADEQRQIIVALISEIIDEQVTETQVAEWLDHGKGVESPRVWTLDPIDGTKGFVDNRHYVNAIGYLENNDPVGALIAAPAYKGGALFYTMNGGAYIEPLDRAGAPRQLHVSDHQDPAFLRGLESVEKSHSSFDRMARVRAFVGIDDRHVERIDSMEKYARVAAGEAELYMRLPRLKSTRPHSTWDHAPGVALIRAAGGIATDVEGSRLDFSTGRIINNQGIIATNGYIHARVIEAVQKLLAEEKAVQSEN